MVKKVYVLKKSEVHNDFVALAEAENFQSTLDELIKKYTPSERGARSAVKFDALQAIIDKTDSEGMSFSSFALSTASQYNVKYGKKAPINPAFFKHWVEKGKIKLPLSPTKRVKAAAVEVVETSPAG
jgi:hypothetical protein